MSDVAAHRWRLRWSALRPSLLPWTRPDSYAAERASLAVLVLLVVVLAVLAVAVGPEAVPTASLVVGVLLGGLLLGPRLLRFLYVAVTIALVFDVWELGWRQVRPGVAVVIAVCALVASGLARAREVLGVSSSRGESMLRELRDRLMLQGQMPQLPLPWHADVAQRSAGAATFGGDFIVAALTHGGSRLELAVVDVSGKGVDAGTRALLLSGALGGLLGAVPAERFMGAANDYLLRQEWQEGFATAVHLAVQLDTGHYRLASAGHPPAAHLVGGSGRWRLAPTEGPVLGLLHEPTFVAENGVLGHRDALLLYTDGLVERPGRDLSVGIDKLLGEAERLVPRGFSGGAAAILGAVAPRSVDDRALVLLWRE